MTTVRPLPALLAASFAMTLGACTDLDPGSELDTDISEAPIIGGHDATPGEYPWQVQLSVPGYAHYCGGSIIDRDWVLTAAHCVEGLTAADFTVRAGLHRRSAPDGNLQTRTVRRVVAHPDYDGWNLSSDIALLELTTPLTYQPRIQSIAIGTGNAPVGTLAPVSGWGQTAPGSASADVLQETLLPVQSAAVCNAAGTLPLTVDDGTMVCAGFVGGASGGCHGDSGGPLVAQRGFSGGYEQIGVVSWGVGGSCSSFTVFARLSTFAPWIASFTGAVIVYGDVDGSGCVNSADEAAIIAGFGLTVPSGDPRDLNYDGVINIFDRLIVLQNMGEGCS